MRFLKTNLNWLLGILTLGALAIGVFYLDPFWAVLEAGFLISIAIVAFASTIAAIRARKAASLTQGELTGIIANLRDGVLVYDENFTIRTFNRAAESIFELKASEIVGQSFTLKVRQDPSPRLQPLLTVLFPALAASIIRRSDPGTYPQIADLSFDEPPLDLRVMTNRILDAEGKLVGFIKVIQDRTREAALLRSKSEFITVASHQLRTPLTGLNWAMDNLKKEPLTPGQHELIENASGATTQLLGIVNDLLDVAKIEEGKFGYEFQQANLIDFLEEALQQSKTVADKYKIRLYLEKPKTALPQVVIDTKKLGLAVANLIDNGVKYNVPNGEVVISVAGVPGKPYLEVRVRDTGIGIPSESISKIFNEFFRAPNAMKASVEGTGLGLYIAKNIVRRHGGSIRVESTLNRGTTVAFTLPTDPKLIPAKEFTGDY